MAKNFRVLLLMLQQYLPFTVLKLFKFKIANFIIIKLQQYLPFTVLKHNSALSRKFTMQVATVLTVYGIETIHTNCVCNVFFSLLQQYLPFTVLKRIIDRTISLGSCSCVATVLTVYGIETIKPYID